MNRFSHPTDAFTRTHASASETRHGLLLGIGIAVLLTGCRGRAQEDLYRQTLQREVRLLEDQLYEADYENRILIDKLRREHNRPPGCDPDEDQKPGRSRSKLPSVKSLDEDRSSLDDALNSGLDDQRNEDMFQPRGKSDTPRKDPIVPEKTPATDTLPRPKPDQRPNASPSTPKKIDADFPDIDSMIEPGTLIDPEELTLPQPSADPNPPRMLPAPGGPTPPGTKDLKMDPIEPGIPQPPATPNGRPDGPPGKIELPPGLGMLGGLGTNAASGSHMELRPQQIRIDTTSSEVRFAIDSTVAGDASATSDGDASATSAGDASVTSDGVDLVVRADDLHGHPIALLGRIHDPVKNLQPDTTAKMRPLPHMPSHLSIVALDPTKTGDEAKLGRWDFDTEQLRELETRSRANQGNGFATTVPIRWNGQAPAGDAVIFFAQLRSGDADVRCEAEVGLKKAPSVAGWLPRR